MLDLGFLKNRDIRIGNTRTDSLLRIHFLNGSDAQAAYLPEARDILAPGAFPKSS